MFGIRSLLVVEKVLLLRNAVRRVASTTDGRQQSILSSGHDLTGVSFLDTVQHTVISLFSAHRIAHNHEWHLRYR